MRLLLTTGVISMLLFFASCKHETEQEPLVDTTPLPTVRNMQLPDGWPAYTIPAGNMLTEEGIALGRRLFYEPLLSGNNQQSCASCHNIEYAFTDNGKRFSEGINGTIGKKNSMPLFNLMWAKKLFWDGRASSLEDQALKPVKDPTEMNENIGILVSELQAHPLYPSLFKRAFLTDQISPELIARALAQFERTLISSGSRFDKSNKGLGLNASEKRGMSIFYGEAYRQFEDPTLPPGGDCFHCHGNTGSVMFSNFEFQNNGLDEQPDSGLARVTGKPSDIGKFRVPSLRNLKFTGPYMHDGRFSTLEQVIKHYDEGVKFNSPNLDPNLKKHEGKKLGLNSNDIQDLINFLYTLNDDEFINNENFKKPQ